jgi:hypothetical protein
MDLKGLLPKKDQESDFYWSLIIEPGWVSAAIWKILEKNAQIFITTPETAWALDEELVNSSDSVLSGAIQNFPVGAKEPSKTVFGVASSWVSGGEIKDEYLEKIKMLCTELSLIPVGFVVIPEAIANLKKSEEGSPLNAVVIGVYKDTAEISVFKLGNLLGTTEVTRSVSLVDDCVEGLTRFAGSESLPSRFIVYDGRQSELEEYRQILISVSWEDYENLKFLHTPKVEIVDEKTKLYAVSLAGGAEIGSTTSLKIENIKEEKLDPVVKEMKEVNTYDEEEEKVSPEDMGFALEKDISQVEEKPKGEEETLTTKEELKADIENVKKVDFKVISGKRFKSFNPISLLHKIPRLSARFSSGRKPFIAGLIFLTLFLVGGFAFWWFYPKAVVAVFVSPQSLNEKVVVTVDLSKDSADFSSKVLTGRKLSVSVDGERTQDTTGTKTVGDKAKGQITLYRVGPGLDLPAGTLLYGPEKLKFTLDDAITVASGSAGSAGETNANVTAQDIGSQYNLASGTSFSVGNYSTNDIEAKNNSNAFSGGSSREITAVSEVDQDNLLKDLTDELKQKALDGLTQDLTKDNYFIDNSLTTTTSSKTFSNKVGDEATTLKLSLILKAEGVVVEKSQLTDFARDALKDKIPGGFVLRGEQVTFNFDLNDVKDGKYTFDLKISANLLPEVNIDAITQNIKGRYPSVALSTLEKEVPGFARAEIKIKPILPGRLKTLPHVAKNISVELAAEK